jgi:protein-disulfide isomerase
MPRLTNYVWIAGLAAGTAAGVTTATLWSGHRATSAPAAASAPAVAPPSAADTISERADAGRIMGSPNVTAWIIEGSDFQCPFCKAWHDDSYAAVIKDYVTTGKFRFAFMNYPLPDLHQNAQAAAEAAMCASAQGKFWPMHESLFATQHEWEHMPVPIPVFDALAMKAGVNPAAWRSCMSTHATAALIAADKTRLRGQGMKGTPTFFIGNQVMVNMVIPLPAFRDSVNKALAKAAKP